MRVTKIVAFVVMLSITNTISYAQESAKMPLINEAKQTTGEISPAQLKQMFDDEKPVIILDAREQEQRAEGDIFDDMFTFATVQIARGNLEWEIEAKVPDKNSLIVTFCRNGCRGALAAQTLHKMGYKNVKKLQGGIADWAKAGYMVKTGLGVIKLKDSK